ncbi:MAG: HigA family addiction module antitoxin [Agriterribacter sp.]
MKKLKNIHPGEILKLEFLKPLHITAYRLSKDTGIPQTRISEIIKGNRKITAVTALRLSRYFGNTAKFWLGLQNDFDLEEAQASQEKYLTDIKHHSSGQV